MACERGITDASSKHIYERLLTVQHADGCELDEVSTNKSETVITWKKGDAAQPSATVVPKDCAAAADAVSGPSLSVEVPDALRVACPSHVKALVTMIQTERFDEPTKEAPRSPRPYVAAAIGFVALAVIAFVLIRRRRRLRVAATPETPAPPPDSPPGPG